MTPLESAIAKIEAHARRWFERPFRDSAFSLALTPAEVDAFTAAYPNGITIQRTRKP